MSKICNVKPEDKEAAEFLLSKGLNPYHRVASTASFEDYLDHTTQLDKSIGKLEIANGAFATTTTVGTKVIPLTGVTRNLGKQFIKDPYQDLTLTVEEMYARHKKIAVGTATGEVLNSAIDTIRNLIITDNVLDQNLLIDLVKIFNRNIDPSEPIVYSVVGRNSNDPYVEKIKTVFDEFFNKQLLKTNYSKILNNKNEVIDNVGVKFERQALNEIVANALVLLNKAIKDLTTANNNRALESVSIEFEKKVILHKTKEIGHIDLIITAYGEEMGLKSIIFDHKTKALDTDSDITSSVNELSTSYFSQLQKYALGVNNMGSEVLAAYLSPNNVITNDVNLNQNALHTVRDFIHENSSLEKDVLKRLGLKAVPFSKSLDSSLDAVTNELSKYMQTLTKNLTSNRVSAGNRSQLETDNISLEDTLINMEITLSHMKKDNLKAVYNAYNLLIKSYDISGFIKLMDDFQHKKNLYITEYSNLTESIEDFKRNNPTANEDVILEEFLNAILSLTEFNEVLINEAKILAPLKNQNTGNLSIGNSEVFTNYVSSLEEHFQSLDPLDSDGVESAIELVINIIHNPAFMDNNRELYEFIMQGLSNVETGLKTRTTISTIHSITSHEVNGRSFFSVFANIFQRKANLISEDAFVIDN